jgi:hypothetical protein
VGASTIHVRTLTPMRARHGAKAQALPCWLIGLCMTDVIGE